MTDAEGRYQFVTIKPGAYPWGNHHNAWRPAHIHFSLFGRAFAQRLVTQMYFPGDPLFPQDPIFNSVRDPKARERMISEFDRETTEPAWALGFRCDIVLRGPMRRRSRSRTIDADRHPIADGRALLRHRADLAGRPAGRPEGTAGAIRLHGTLFDGAGEPIPDALVETWQADPDGIYHHPDDPRGADSSFRGFGRAGTDDEGRWWVLTVKPGPVPGPGGTTQAPHIDVSVFARGLLHRVVTRIYFPDEEEANAADPVLAALPATPRLTP